MSNIQTDISLSTLDLEYMVLYHSVRDFLTLNIIIKLVIENLVMDSENLKFVSSSTVYK